MRSSCVSTLRRRVVLLIAALLAVGVAWAQVPSRNVNMVSGTDWPGGDPFLQRQNEPTVAVSTRNPMHLVAGANDYRTVDLPGMAADKMTGDAWLGVFTSYDGGATWKSTLLPGYPQEAGSASPLHGFDAGADPVVRAGPHGLFYYSGIAFNRDNPVLEARRRREGGAVTAGVADTSTSVVFVARYIDNNNKENGEPIAYLGTTIVAQNTNDNVFLDKPWLAVDMPRLGAGTCTVTQALEGKTVTQALPAGNAYVVYSQFTGKVSDGSALGTLMFTRSTNCGVTWSTPVAISGSHHVNQGATIALDPRTGTVYVVWRRFAWPLKASSPTERDAILIARSLDRGRTFTAPEVVTEFQPFDQPTGAFKYQFRTSAYPAAGVDRLGRVLVAYSARGVQQPHGDARILLRWARYPSRLRALFSDEDDGTETSKAGDARPTWTTPAPIDPDLARRGHQIMPSMLVTGLRVQVAWVDLQEDHTWGEYTRDPATGQWLESRVPSAERLDSASTVFNPLRINDEDVHTRRHSADVWIAQASPGDRLTFTARRASDYKAGTRHDGDLKVEQLQFNPPNLPLFKQGTASFWGDYIDLGAQPLEQKLPKRWRQALQPAASHVVFTDNRDVRAPADGLWDLYTPPFSPALNPSGTFQPGTAPCECDPAHPERAGMRNQNVYAARVTQGLFVSTPGNAKPLGRIKRAFVVSAANDTFRPRTFRMTIPTQPSGGSASFKQFAVLTRLDVTIGPRSSVSRTVYVRSTDPRALVKVDVSEVSGGVIVPPISGGLQGTAVINPDTTNPDMMNPDMMNPDMMNPDVLSAEIYTPDMMNPDMMNPDMMNPDMMNPDMMNPDMMNPDMMNPDMMNPDMMNPGLDVNAAILNPDMMNPDMMNTDLINGTMTDTVWTLTNNGNTTAAYDVRLVLRSGEVPEGIKTQLLLYKTYTTPVAKDCQLVQETQNVLIASIPNPRFDEIGDPLVSDPADGSLEHATLWLAPGESGKITLRVVDPDKTDGVTFDPVTEIAPAVAPQSVDTASVAAGKTTPDVVTTSPIVFLARPTATPIGGYVTPPVEVLVQDEDGAPIAGATVNLSLSSNPGTATLRGGTATSGPDGIATFSQLWLDRLGSGYRLQATVGTKTSQDSGPFDVVPLVVSSTDDSGPGTLRQAIENANRNVGYPDAIAFDIDGGGVHTIAPASALPAITDAVTIDAATQSGYGGTPLIEINGQAVAGTIGLDVGPDAPGSVIRGLSIYGFSSGISLGRPGGSVVEACYLGLDAAGVAHGNYNGVWIGGQSDANRIGGSTPAARNVIGGNASTGILIDGGSANVIAGNYIGTDPSGSAARPNGQGVLLRQTSVPRLTANNIIGGTAPGEGNVISGNTGAGIALQSHAGLAPTGTLISGNTIGLDAAGVADLGNAPGIQASGPNTRIISNVISGNGHPGGISLTGLADGAVIQGNKIGTDAAGGSALPNEPYGVHISGASISSVTLGGAAAGQGNLVSGNIYAGVYVMLQAHGVVIQGNRIGTDATGTRSLDQQQWGVRVTDGAYGVTVGGTTPLAGNLVSGNVYVGVGLDNTHDNLVVGNRIGTDATGTAAVPNRGDAGVLVASSTGDRIGTGDPGAGNLISGNTLSGIELFGPVANLRIAGNLIGTSANGLSSIRNTYGIVTYSVSGANTIGGTALGERNVISGNAYDGVFLNGTQGLTLFGNYIGPDVTGMGGLGNTMAGVNIYAGGQNVIGGFGSGQGNLLSGNGGNGVTLASSSGNRVVGNRIGTNAAATAALPNNALGVAIYHSIDDTIGGTVPGSGNLISGNLGGGIFGSYADRVTISGNLIGTNSAGTAALGSQPTGVNLMWTPGAVVGGGSAADRNVISGHSSYGVVLDAASGNRLAGNFIGTSATGTAPIPNGYFGVGMINGAADNTIGGTAGEANTIAFNVQGGVAIGGDTDVRNAVSSNRIHSNGGLGIDLWPQGVNPNDPGDGDTGPNDRLNYPVLSSAVDNGTRTTVSGSVDLGVPGATVTVQFFHNASCDPSGYGEGQTPVGETTFATSAGGTGTFVANLAGGMAPGFITATTVLPPANTTSEFSACRSVTGGGGAGFAFTQVSAGDMYTCGVKTDGAVACWGETTTVRPRRRQAPSPR